MERFASHTDEKKTATPQSVAVFRQGYPSGAPPNNPETYQAVTTEPPNFCSMNAFTSGE